MLLRLRNKRPGADDAQESATGESEPVLVAGKKVRYVCQTERGYEAVQGIRRGSAHTREETSPPSMRERAPRAQDADRPYRSGDDKADNKSFEEDLAVINQSIERIKILVNDLTHLQNPEIIDYTSENKMVKLT